MLGSSAFLVVYGSASLLPVFALENDIFLVDVENWLIDLGRNCCVVFGYLFVWRREISLKLCLLRALRWTRRLFRKEHGSESALLYIFTRV